MKKALLITAVLMFVCGIAHATVGLIIDSTPYGAVTDLKCTSTGGALCNYDGSTLSIGTSSAGSYVTMAVSGNVGVGTTRITKGALEVDGNVYIPSANITASKALCFTSTQLLGHCSDTPTSGSCTCVAN